MALHCSKSTLPQKAKLSACAILVYAQFAHCQTNACEDDATFSDAFGSPCGDWDAANRPGRTCAEAGTDWGYTGDQLGAATAACPLSCDTCPETVQTNATVGSVLCPQSAFTSDETCAAGEDDVLVLFNADAGPCAHDPCTQGDCCRAVQCADSSFSSDDGCAGGEDAALVLFDADAGPCAGSACEQAECCQPRQQCGVSSFSPPEQPCVDAGTNNETESPAQCWSNREQQMTCADGTVTATFEGVWPTCASNGGRLRCPSHRPYMCAEKSDLGGTEYWCKQALDGCDAFGGPSLSYQSLTMVCCPVY